MPDNAILIGGPMHATTLPLGDGEWIKVTTMNVVAGMHTYVHHTYVRTNEKDDAGLQIFRYDG